jgi:hypothetical protein
MHTKESFEQIKDAAIDELGSALESAGLSITWAARQIGKDHSAIGRVLSRKNRPSLELALQMRELAERVNRLRLVV